MRGAMEIIVATIGLAGVLNQQMYSIIVMVAIVTSLITLCDTFKVEMGEEAQRLQQEEQASQLY